MITGTDYPALLSTSHTECWAGQWEDWSRLSTVGFVKVDNINQVQHQHCIITPQTDTAPGHAGAFSASREIMSDVWRGTKTTTISPSFNTPIQCQWTDQWPVSLCFSTELRVWRQWATRRAWTARTMSVVSEVVVSQETTEWITICYPGATLTPSIKQMDQHRPTQAALASPPDPPHYTQ